jgi:hypothetical protein
VEEILPSYLADTRKARVLGPAGQYHQLRKERGLKSFSVQQHFMDMAQARANGAAPHRAHMYLSTEPVPAAIVPTETLEAEVQDATNASV